METTPLWQWSAGRLRQAYLAGTVTPLDALNACLERIDHVNPRLNAMIARRDAADDARRSTERYRRGQPLSEVDGIPVSVKDNLCTHDMPTTWGSRGLQNNTTGTDELPVARLRASGALIVGKTNVPEFTLEGYTDNPLFGVTRNPWNTSLTPGGSSGGAVAGVSAGCTPLAIGTDGGGSIRRPSSHCGLVGLKPSIGAIARLDGLPSLLLDFEVVGPMARTVNDARLLFNVLRGPDPRDRASLAAFAACRPSPSNTTLNQPRRILYVPTLDNAPVDPEIAASCLGAMQALRDLGHEITVGRLPLDLSWLTDGWPRIGQIGLAALFAGHRHWGDSASEKYRNMAEQGAAMPGHQLWNLLATVDHLRRDCVELFRQWDIIAMPSAAALPWPAEQAFPTEIAGQPVGPRGHALFTGWVNAAGLPAISVPTAPAENGLPIGVQLIGAYGADDAILDLAQAYEEQAPWADRRPVL